MDINPHRDAQRKNLDVEIGSAALPGISALGTSALVADG